MSNNASELSRAFREDHAVLGRLFHRLSTALRAGDGGEAHRIAEQLDRQAGPHIAFEEEDFYPALRAMIGSTEVARLYEEHGDGLGVVDTLVDLADDTELTDKDRVAFLSRSERMEKHIAECDELFAAIGRLTEDEQRALFTRLNEWRRRGPTWRSLVAQRDQGRMRPGGRDS